jgi:hypothetical protein
MPEDLSLRDICSRTVQVSHIFTTDVFETVSMNLTVSFLVMYLYMYLDMYLDMYPFK